MIVFGRVGALTSAPEGAIGASISLIRGAGVGRNTSALLAVTATADAVVEAGVRYALHPNRRSDKIGPTTRKYLRIGTIGR